MVTMPHTLNSGSNTAQKVHWRKDSKDLKPMLLYLHFGRTDDLKSEMIIPRSREASVESVAEEEPLSDEKVQHLARQRLLSQLSQMQNLSPGELQRLAREELKNGKASFALTCPALAPLTV